MSYTHETRHYHIPSADFGDFFNADDEQRRAEIVDTQLFGSVLAHSAGHGVLKEGTYSASFVSGASSVALNSSSTDVPSAMAFIDQKFIRTFDTLSWTGLLNNKTYYLFIQLVESTTQSSSRYGHVVTYFSEDSTIPVDALLVAKATTTGVEIILDTNPIGKTKIYTVSDHAALSADPHGTVLEQTFMSVSGLTVLQRLDFKEGVIHNTIDVEGSLNVTGKATFQDGFTVIDDFTCSGLSTFSGLVTFYQPVEADEITTSGLEVLGQTTFSSPVVCGSGIGIDGIDVSELQFLIDGSNADWDGHKGHIHDGLSGLGINWISFNPIYRNTVEYDKGDGALTNFYEDNRTWYKWLSANPVSSGVDAITLVTRVTVPSDMNGIDTNEVIIIGNRVDNYSASGITVTLFDTEGNQATLIGANNIENLAYTQDIICVSGNPALIFDRGNIFTIMTELTSISGTGCWLSDLKFKYTR